MTGDGRAAILIAEAEFDSTVRGFYAAATGATSWDAALSGVQRAFQARTAVIQSVDLASGRIVQLSSAGEPMPEAFLEYARHWHAVDPRRRHLLMHAPEILGRWWHCHEHFDEAFAARNPFYRHFLAGQRTRYMATSLHQPSPGTLTGIGLELPAARGPLDADERHLAVRLSGHFDDALRAQERMRTLASRALAGHTLLDAFAYPMWLLDGERRVFHSNPAARVLEGAGRTAEVRDGRLFWPSDKLDRYMAELLLSLGTGVRHGHRSTVDARRTRSDPPSWLHLHALEPSRVLGEAFGGRPLVLATLFDPQQMGNLDAFALCEMFSMTPAEGRVAALLAQGKSAQVLADLLGCKESTVRTHLRNVLTKLGAARLTDAVRLLRQGEVLWALSPRASRATPRDEEL